MSFNKKQAKEIVRRLGAAHGKDGFRLAAYVAVGADMKSLTHFHSAFVATKRETVKDVFEAFRRKFPHGQYLIIVVCGDDVPEYPPSSQPVRRRIAKLRGTFKPRKEALVLSLDTNWLDKAFEYQKRLTY